MRTDTRRGWLASRVPLIQCNVMPSFFFREPQCICSLSFIKLPDPWVYSSPSHFDVFFIFCLLQFCEISVHQNLVNGSSCVLSFSSGLWLHLFKLIKKNNNMSGGVGVFHFAALLMVVLVPPRVSPVGGWLAVGPDAWGLTPLCALTGTFNLRLDGRWPL